MALLRASSEALGDEAGLEATVGRGGDAGVEHGAALVRFAEAITRGSDDATTARDALLLEVGHHAFVEAASIVGIFNGLVRVADSSGIPLDEGTRQASASFRGDLGLEAYAGAANTKLDATSSGPAPDDVEKMFR